MASPDPRPGDRPSLLDRLLTDRTRRWAAPAVLAALGALYVHYGVTADAAATSYREIMEDPDPHVGRTVVLAFYRAVALREDGFDARSWGMTAPVVGHLPGLRVGHVVSVEGVLRPDYRVDLRFGYVHRWRWHKKAIGVVVLAVMAVLFARDWRRGHPPGEARPG